MKPRRYRIIRNKTPGWLYSAQVLRFWIWWDIGHSNHFETAESLIDRHADPENRVVWEGTKP